MGHDDSAIIQPQWKKTEVFGLIMMLTGLAVFTALAAQLGTPSVQRFDETVVRSLRNAEDLAQPIGPTWFKELARDFTALGGYGILSTITLLVTTFLHLERRPARAHFVVVAIVAGYSLSMTLKALIARPRPDIVPWLSHVHSSSFPSGHSMMSAVVYLSLGLMLSDLTSRRLLKTFVVVAPLTISALVGLSRVYMGVHYPTDVVAGWWLGISWSLACWLAIRRWRAFREVRKALSIENENAT
ncbi:MAG: phosphatase PAP2 family protein [Planctomycetaceae bacterium]|nr:phosphatase PAP2 family protein [Planctomycetaceae bacterium]